MHIHVQYNSANYRNPRMRCELKREYCWRGHNELIRQITTAARFVVSLCFSRLFYCVKSTVEYDDIKSKGKASETETEKNKCAEKTLWLN